MMKYKYLVAYQFKADEKEGLGNFEFISNATITSQNISEIRELYEEYIEKNLNCHNASVVILNIMRLEEVKKDE